MLWLALISSVFAAEKFINVAGHCQREVVPDRASIVLMAEVSDPKPAVAADKATKLYEKLRAEIKKLKLPDVKLQTSTYTVQQIVDWQSGKRVNRGYQAQMGLEVETSSVGRMGEVLELGTKLGIQNISSLNTFLSSAKAREEHESCLEDAVKNARMKADRMAKAGGTKVGAVIAMEEYKRDAQPRVPVPMYAKAEMTDSSAGGAPGIEAKAQNVNVTVYVTYGLN